MDSWAIDKLDAAMLWLQKRGASLVAIHCWVMAAIFVVHLGRSVLDDNKLSMLLCSFWAGLTWGYARWGAENRDYRENWRMAQKLNAAAIGLRDRERKARQIWMPLLIGMVIFIDGPLIFEKTLVGSLGGLGTLLVVFSIYLNTSTYLAGGQPRSQSVPNGVHADGR